MRVERNCFYTSINSPHGGRLVLFIFLLFMFLPFAGFVRRKLQCVYPLVAQCRCPLHFLLLARRQTALNFHCERVTEQELRLTGLIPCCSKPHSRQELRSKQHTLHCCTCAFQERFNSVCPVCFHSFLRCRLSLCFCICMFPFIKAADQSAQTAVWFTSQPCW